MTKLWMAIIGLALVPWAFAQDLSVSPETQEVCNRVMMNIYQDILEVKEKHKELADFGEKALFKNPYDIYAIIYQFGETKPDERDPRKQPFSFGLTIDRMGNNSFPDREGVFNLGFPAMGLKFSGYQSQHLRQGQMDLLPFLKRHGDILAEYQQQFLPLRLYIQTEKDTFKVQEDILFEVVLKNVSKRNMLVDPLNETTLYFLVDNEYWGAGSPEIGKKPKPKRERTARTQRPGPQLKQKGQKIILRSGETLSLKLKGASFLIPRQVDIYAAYQMKVQDTHPEARLKINIVE